MITNTEIRENENGTVLTKGRNYELLFRASLS